MRLGSLQPKFDKTVPSLGSLHLTHQADSSPLLRHRPPFFYSEPDHGFGTNSTMQFSATRGRSFYMPPRKGQIWGGGSSTAWHGTVWLLPAFRAMLSHGGSGAFLHETVNHAQATNGRGERACRGLEPSEAKASEKTYWEPSPKLRVTCP